MLNFFRQKGLSNVLYVAILVATMLTFVIEFRPNASSRRASLNETCVARVRGRCIDPKTFSSALRLVVPSRNPQLARRVNVKKVALDGLVERELLADEGRRLGITVTDDEVTDQLYDGFIRVSVPAADPSIAQSVFLEMYQSYARASVVSQEMAQAHFNQRDGAIPVDFRDPKTKAFDMKVYERQVRNLSNRGTAEFREEQARELLAAKVRDIVRAPIRVSDAEAWEQYDRQFSTATVAWIPVKESWAARWAVNMAPENVDAWVKENADVVGKAVESRVKEDAPKAGHLRHILAKLPYGASDDEKALALAKLSWAAARIKAGEAFAEVARDASDDTGSAANGGDVGDKTDSFVPPFRAAGDALQPGETTAGAVETQFGYHLIMRDDPSKAAEIQAAVKKGVPRRMFAQAKATDASKAIAKQIDDAMRGGKPADDALRDVLGPLSKAEKVERLRVLPAAATADGGAPEADAKTAARPPAHDAHGAGAGTAAATNLPSKRFDATTDADRPQVEVSSAFNRGGDPFPGLSPDGAASVLAFAFGGKEGDVLSDPVRTSDGFVVVSLKQHKIATREEFEKDRDAFQEDLVRAKRDDALARYVRRLRDQAKDAVKVDESYVQESKADAGAAPPVDDDEDQY
ncbi:MAG: peptidylprolyl isomerase [Polyangiaceae bacterium]|nr:peptidylprolyl isomerase [Polyangiaceae bacterium]